jgi:hypothetical protein
MGTASKDWQRIEITGMCEKFLFGSVDRVHL